MTDEAVNPWAKVIGPCYTVASLARALGWAEAEIATAANALMILELETVEGTLLYPAFQVHDGRVVDGLQEVLRVLATGTGSRWTWAQWLNTRLTDRKGNEEPNAIEQIRAGHLEDVLLEARHDAASWSS